MSTGMRKKALFLDSYFYPESTSFSHLEDDIINCLIDNEYSIEVLCPTPTRGIDERTRKAYRNKKDEFLYDGKVHVKRFYVPRERKNVFLRALRYFICNIKTYFVGKKYKNVDIVFSNSTPPTQGLIAGFIAKKINKPFVYSLQDIFPDSLIASGICKERSLLYKIGQRIEKKTYTLCSKIITITQSMKSNLIGKGVDEDRILIVSNWVDTELIKPVKKSVNCLFNEFHIDKNKKIVLYAGNIGEAQGADIILDTANLLSAKKDIFFVVFGGGNGFEDFKIKARKLDNLFVHDLLPQDKVSYVYSMADVALIICKAGVGKAGMPSKTWNIMACNVPIAASFDIDSDLNSVLKQSSSGLCVEPNNASELCQAILTICDNPARFSNGRPFIEQNCSKRRCVTKILLEFDKLTRKGESYD